MRPLSRVTCHASRVVQHVSDPMAGLTFCSLYGMRFASSIVHPVDLHPSGAKVSSASCATRCEPYTVCQTSCPVLPVDADTQDSLLSRGLQRMHRPLMNPSCMDDHYIGWDVMQGNGCSDPGQTWFQNGQWSMKHPLTAATHDAPHVHAAYHPILLPHPSSLSRTLPLPHPRPSL